MLSVAAGDLNKVKWEIKPTKSPYIKFKLHGFTDKTLDNYIDAFEDYIDALEDAVEKKIPKILEEAMELADKAENVKDNAVSEFDALDPFEKIKAMGKSVKVV
jgi:hypothetical protein